MKVLKATLLLTLITLIFASALWAETCEYDTAWGVLTITYNYNNNTVSGRYPYRSGRITGNLYQNGVIKGFWTQSDGRGAFTFTLNQSGFTGLYNYAGDSGWRGQWNGSLRGCYKD